MTTKLRECLGLKTVAAGRPNTSPDYIAGASDQHHADEKALWKALESVEPTAEVSVEERDYAVIKHIAEIADKYCPDLGTEHQATPALEIIDRYIHSHTTALKGRMEELEKHVKDTERLDFLDKCNRGLNEYFGTTYKWEFILNHNVTRLMCGQGRAGYIDVDLNDANANGLPSCRDAIDKKMAELITNIT